ncbi:deoxyribodipyrimidine photo-lyase [Acidisoma sp. S159]|uniref:cryptochrome/photolyase family protein n=1 Tax=Acidisoma sp. S159 TaxID=1747225 RepID=UPI00131BCD18|nr:deoxyribodipyrimidine photo-lyase [Acidisoma sp. S159]
MARQPSVSAASGPAIVWYRRDLRVNDHAPLRAAAKAHGFVLPVFVLDDEGPGGWKAGAASQWWLHHSLERLAEGLRARGADLLLRRGPRVSTILTLAREVDAAEVHTGIMPEPWEKADDAEVAAGLAAEGRRLVQHRTSLLHDPDAVRTQAGKPFTVFTPFARAFAKATHVPEPVLAPRRLKGAKLSTPDRLDAWRLLPAVPWDAAFSRRWEPGEAGAKRRAQAFMNDGLAGYATGRNDIPSDGSSSMSPHLHWGEISPVQLWHAVAQAPQPHGAGAEAYRRELVWREFTAHVLWHHPETPDAPLRAEFKKFERRHDPGQLRAWQKGKTGVPIVDAGMRQLWSIGWMHNRVRMITASFLVKHLLLPWEEGEAWFWDTLVDADLANNAVNWQWVAGCGADAAPFFRIFNPVLQGQKFDPEGTYVRHWVPELAKLESRYIHEPWSAPVKALEAAGVKLGETYPRPQVDLSEGRARALAALRAITRKAA